MKPGLKQLTRVGWLVAAVLVAAATDTRAQNPYPVSVVGTFTVNPKMGGFGLDALGQVNFTSKDPDTDTSLTADPLPFHLTWRGPVQIVISADGELVSGSDKIPLSKMTAECTITGQTGTPPTSITQTGPPVPLMLKTDRTLIAVDSGEYTGTIVFRLANDWTYAAGTYTMSVTITAVTV